MADPSGGLAGGVLALLLGGEALVRVEVRGACGAAVGRAPDPPSRSRAGWSAPASLIHWML